MKMNTNTKTAIKNPRTLNMMARQLDKMMPCDNADNNACLHGDVFDTEALCDTCKSLTLQVGGLLPESENSLLQVIEKTQFQAYYKRIAFLLLLTAIDRLSEEGKESVKNTEPYASKISKVMEFLSVK